jgi:hypothetical protein
VSGDESAAKGRAMKIAPFSGADTKLCASEQVLEKDAMSFASKYCIICTLTSLGRIHICIIIISEKKRRDNTSSVATIQCAVRIKGSNIVLKL